MGFTYRRSVWVVPGLVKYNVNAHSRSMTYHLGLFSLTRSNTGRRTLAVNLPGRLGYRKQWSKATR
jgi:hypothetical protein